MAQVVARQVFIRCQDTGCFAGFEDAAKRVFNRGFHFGVGLVAHMAHGCRQIGGPDEHAVHAFDSGNRVEVFQGSGGLGLHQQTHLLVGLLGVLRVPAPARGACAAHAANAVRRVTHGFDQGFGLFGGVDHGHQDGGRAHVHVLLDQGGAGVAVAHRHAHDGVGIGVCGDDLQLHQDGLQVVGRMFAVEQQPVKAGTGANFGGVGACQTGPQPVLHLFVLNGLFEAIDRCFHGVSVV